MNYLLVALLLLTYFSVQTVAEPTVVSYIVDTEEEERQDFLEVTFSTHAEGESLQAAVEQSRNEANNLKQAAEDICRQLIKDKKQCDEAVEIGKVEIEPVYQQVKRDTVYEKIKTKFEVVITWKDVKGFGVFVDRLLQVQGIIIEKIEWQPDEDLMENKFLEESLDKRNALCAELGKKVKRIVSVEEMRDQPEKPEEEPPAEEGEEEEEEQEPEEEEEPEEEDETTSYRITIECDGVAQAKKKKK